MFSFFRFLKNGGNFSFVAQNIVAIYYALKETSFGGNLSDAQLLYATALIDTLAYTSTGQIRKSELELGVLSARICEVSVGFYGGKIYSYFDNADNKELICLAMQLEAMIFCADNTKFNYKQIVDMVIEKKPLIEKVVNEAAENPSRLGIYKNVLANVTAIAKDTTFQEEVLKFE